MGKKKMSDVKIANDEVLFIIFYQGRGIINAFGEEIFMSEKEYVMIQGATGRDKISVHAEYPQIMITFTGLSMSESIMRGCLKNQSMKIVSMLINEINEKQFGYIHNCESLINMLLILLHRERNQTSERLTDSERRNYCEKVNSYVQKHYLESPQMEFLANKFLAFSFLRRDSQKNHSCFFKKSFCCFFLEFFKKCCSFLQNNFKSVLQKPNPGRN